MVPPCAASNDPARAATAPVNAPRACPNSSPSISELASAAQSTITNGPAARADASWIARAASSLPVPVSPRISTGASLCATRAICANSSRIGVLAPIRPPKLLVRPQLDRRRRRRIAQHDLGAAHADARAVGQQRGAHLQVLDEGPVAAAEIAHPGPAIGRLQLGVQARHLAVGDAHLGARRRAERRPPGDRALVRAGLVGPGQLGPAAHEARGLFATELGLVVVLAGGHQRQSIKGSPCSSAHRKRVPSMRDHGARSRHCATVNVDQWTTVTWECDGRATGSGQQLASSTSA